MQIPERFRLDAIRDVHPSGSIFIFDRCLGALTVVDASMLTALLRPRMTFSAVNGPGPNWRPEDLFLRR
jgi:hypothetical protein